MSARTLIVVESSTKSKEIAHILQASGRNDCDVTYTGGHFLDLPNRSFGIEKDSNGNLDLRTYMLIPKEEKKNVIAKLKSMAAGKHILIAADPDREGEAIAANIRDVVRTSRPSPLSIRRIRIKEITPEGISRAMNAPPEDVNQNTVNAQIVRRATDRAVGFEGTPLAAKAFGVDNYRDATVGRTQSVAAAIVGERCRRIEEFKPEPYWKITYTDPLGTQFVSEAFKSEEEAACALKMFQSREENLSILSVVKKRTSEAPPKPLKSSSLQQLCHKIRKWKPDKTMTAAQNSFEHGDISYPRTDSVRLAPETIDAVREYLKKRFPKYVGERPPSHTNKNRTQDAHEAIHPTDSVIEEPWNTDDGKRKNYTEDEKFIYSLIRGYFLASQSVPALYDTVKVSVGIPGEEVVLNASGKTLVFEGWRFFLNATVKDKTLPDYSEESDIRGGVLALKKEFTKPEPWFNIATFTKYLEDNGIGRPSTYANIVKTVFDRGFVVEDKDRLLITPKGKDMVNFLSQVFPEIINVQFTARMEDALDKVELGEAHPQKVMNAIYSVVKKALNQGESIPPGSFRKEWTTGGTSKNIARKSSPAKNTRSSSSKRSSQTYHRER